MTLFACKSISGFIDSDFGNKIPEDAVEITTELHVHLLNGESNGKVIVWHDNSVPTLAEPSGPTRASVELSRQQEYANPATGSDRFFAEYTREMAVNNFESAEDAKQKGLSRYAEIQAKYPWPE